jgi:hypothetical protein
VGHADYPFPVNEQAAKSSKTTVLSANTGTTMPGALDIDNNSVSVVVPATEPRQPSEHLQESLKNYLSSRQSIRLPPLQANISQQTKRVLQRPMFRKNQHEGMDPLSQLSNTIQGGGAVESAKPRTLRRVTFGSIMFGGDTSVISSKRNMGETSAARQEESLVEAQEEPTSSYQLILPDEMPIALQESIQDSHGPR